MIEVTCTSERHGRAVLARLVRKPRWDGAGHYWVRLADMTDREARAWQAMEPGDGSQTPRDYRSPSSDGFYWLRDGARVVDPREARIISNALHHGRGEHRQGPPAAGVLEGVARRFELEPCKCGKGGGIRAAARPVEMVLERALDAGVTEVDIALFRDAIQRVR